MHANDIRRQEIDGLSEHGRLRLDATYAPRYDPKRVDHRGVGVRPDQRIRVINAVLRMNASREILEIDLVHDADARRNYFECVESLHTPLQEFVAFCIALELDLHVEVERVLGTVMVDLNGVITHQVHRHQRFDHLRILAHPLCGAAHRGEVAKQRNAREILEQHPRDDKGNLVGPRRTRIPIGQLPYVLFGNLFAVTVPKHALEHDTDGNRQPRYFPGRHLL